MKKTSSKQKKAQTSAKNTSVVDVTRKIKDLERLLLFVRAGGRCEFDGCNKYLLEHHVTLTQGNFAQMAHIVAFSDDGPRGNEKRPANINDVSNLMALCPECHKLIDDNPEKFSKATLVAYKEEHERQIRHLTGLGPEQKTSVLVVKSKIGSHTVAVPFDQILEAVSPKYPSSKDPYIIDLTQLPADSPHFVGAASDAIRSNLQTFFGANGDFAKTGHVSLFGLATIPLLCFLGTQLTNKVSLDLYQRHRDKENWTWKKGQKPVQYVLRELQKGSDSSSVALMLSLSGSINQQALPHDVREKFWIYEMSLEGVPPNPTFLNTRADLEAFRVSYQIALGNILKNHPGIKSLHLFPAVPAPVAILCGRELLPKVHPELLIYDNDKQKGGFSYQLTINQS